MANTYNIFNKLYLLFQAVRRRGIKSIILLATSNCIDYCFDLKYKTDTHSCVSVDDLAISNSQKAHAMIYQPTQAVPLRKLLRHLNIPSGKTLVDFGCGKGRVLLVASEFGFKETRGVEVSPLLCKIAENNCAIYNRKTNVGFSIICLDVLDYTIQEDEDVFFLFNPFDDYILRQIIQNINTSILKRKRKVWIIYCNPIFKEIIEQNISCTKIRPFVFWQQNFIVFEIEIKTSI